MDNHYKDYLRTSPIYGSVLQNGFENWAKSEKQQIRKISILRVPKKIVHTVYVCFYIFLAPRIFPILYSLARPFLSEDTKRKIKILGSKYFVPKLYKSAKVPLEGK